MMPGNGARFIWLLFLLGGVMADRRQFSRGYRRQHIYIQPLKEQDQESLTPMAPGYQNRFYYEDWDYYPNFWGGLGSIFGYPPPPPPPPPPKGCSRYNEDIGSCTKKGCIYSIKNRCCYPTFEDVTNVCRESNGNEQRCKSQGCTACPCNFHCVPPGKIEKCPTDCSQYCTLDKCFQNFCLFDYRDSKCHDPKKETNIDLSKVCAYSSGNQDNCLRQGCKFCRCSKLCVPPYMQDKCDPGCTKNCDNINACTSKDCLYDYNTNLCYDIDGNGDLDLDVLCSASSGNRNKCEKQGCKFCKCSTLCKSPKKECDPGCSKYCNAIEQCAGSSLKCIYDYEDNECYDTIDNGDGLDALLGLCSKSDGDGERCVAQGCAMCRCSKNCVPPILAHQCDPKCSRFCSMVDQCVANSCVYDYNSESCFEPTSSNLQSICEASDGNPDDCVKQGCIACECSKKCVPKSMAGKCDPGCSRHCQDIDGCREAGCVYDTINTKCYSNKDNSVDLVEICIVNGGDPATCVQQGCHSCPCSKNCVPMNLSPTCDPGCTKYCGSPMECFMSEEGCIYDSRTSECHDSVGTGPIDMTKICREYDGNMERCTQEGCIFCPCSTDCKAPSNAQECDPGCSKWCGEADECAAFGCQYDYVTARCNDDGSGAYRFCANICGEEFTDDSNGAWYKPFRRQEINVLKRRPRSHCKCSPNLPAVQESQLKPLIECGYASPEMEMYIPIREDGRYIIGLHIAELDKFSQRTFTVRLNNHIIVDSFNTDTILVLGMLETLKTQFIVRDSQTTLIIGNPPMEYPIVDRQLLLNLISVSQQTAILSGFYIQLA